MFLISKNDLKKEQSPHFPEWHQFPSPEALMLMIHIYYHGCMRCQASARIVTLTQGFLHAAIGSKDFSLTEVLLFHEPLESPIMGASEIGQVFTSKSSIYFKYFYLLNNWNTFLLSKRRNKQENSDLEESKIQDPKIHHILYQWCRSYTPAHGGTSFHDGATYTI